MSDCLPIYGCPTEFEATPAFERLVIHGQVFVLRNGAYVPEADADLISAFRQAGREPGDPEADTLLAELRHRGLDI